MLAWSPVPRQRIRLPTTLLLGLLLACPTPSDPDPPGWEAVARDLPGALLSVWGTSSQDVWVVGADSLDGQGPTVLHFDGSEWTRLVTPVSQGNLWWVFGFADGPVYLGGEGGLILRYQDGSFTRMETPAASTVFGIWGATPDDVWAVGGDSDATGGFAWRLQGDTWAPEPSLPADVSAGAAVWKVYGTAADDAWFVGSNGVALHWDGTSLRPGDTGVGSSLFTVHAAGDRYVAVGGAASGIIVEYEGDAWTNVTPDPPPQGLSGVALGPDGGGIAVGAYGSVYARQDGSWTQEDLGFNVAPNLHGSWIDEGGGVWAAGGQTYSPPFDDGILLHRGESVPTDGLETATPD